MMQNEPSIDIRLSDEEIDFLWDAIRTSIEEQEGTDWRDNTAGNASRSKLIDKDDWFFETTFKKLTEKMFYGDWKEEPLPEFKLTEFWVNLQKKHDFVFLHHHGGCLFSFVIFVKIPTHWKEQHVKPKDEFQNENVASDFQFVWSEKDIEGCMTRNFSLSSEDEGRMLFFPATLLHQVYPFYECEEERITISGNIDFYDPNESDRPNRPKIQEIPVGEYEAKEEILKIMENSVRITKEQLKWMKKERGKEE